MKQNKFFNILKKNYLFLYFFIYLIFNLVIIYFTPLVKWDESVYIGIGKYIYSAGKVGLYESFRPSLLPLILGFVWKIGLNHVFFYRLVVLLFSIGNLYLFYKICEFYFNKEISILLMILLSVLPIYFIYSTKIMTGIVSSFFVLLSFYFYKKLNFNSLMFFLGLAIISRFPAGMFLIFFSIIIFLKEKYYLFSFKKMKKGLKLCFFLILGISPFFLINFWFSQGLIHPLILALQHQSNSVFAQDYLFYFKNLLLMSPFFIFIIPGIFYSIKKRELELIVFSIIPLLYFVNIINTHVRFLNLFLPFLVLISAYGFHNLFKKLKFRFLVIVYIFLIFFSFLHFSNYDQELEFNKSVPNFFYLNEVGKVMTADPTFVAYSDNEFLPIYFNVYQGRSLYFLNKEKVDLIIYFDAYPCEFYEIPEDCKLYKDDILLNLQTRNLILNNSGYLIYN